MVVNRATGNLFWGCSAHASTGCRWSASPVTGEEWGHPAVVSRRSKNRSRVMSRRELAVAQAVSRGLGTHFEVYALANSIGLHELEKMVAA